MAELTWQATVTRHGRWWYEVRLTCDHGHWILERHYNVFGRARADRSARRALARYNLKDQRRADTWTIASPVERVGPIGIRSICNDADGHHHGCNCGRSEPRRGGYSGGTPAGDVGPPSSTASGASIPTPD